MRIAVLGAGNVGGSLASAAVAAGHDVVVSATTEASARAVAQRSNARAAASNKEAVDGADLVVLAVPHASVEDIAAEIGDLTGIVVDATNPLNASFTGLTTDGASAAENLQRLLPSARVVKAFNTVFAARLGAPSEGDIALDAYLAGDDAAAKAVVAELASSLAFQPVDVGGLRMARALEEMAFLNISLNAINGLPFMSAWKLVGPTTSVN